MCHKSHRKYEAFLWSKTIPWLLVSHPGADQQKIFHSLLTGSPPWGVPSQWIRGGSRLMKRVPMPHDHFLRNWWSSYRNWKTRRQSCRQMHSCVLLFSLLDLDRSFSKSGLNISTSSPLLCTNTGYLPSSHCVFLQTTICISSTCVNYFFEKPNPPSLLVREELIFFFSLYSPNRVLF